MAGNTSGWDVWGLNFNNGRMKDRFFYEVRGPMYIPTGNYAYKTETLAVERGLRPGAASFPTIGKTGAVFLSHCRV